MARNLISNTSRKLGMFQQNSIQDFDALSSNVESNAFEQNCDGIDQILDLGVIIPKAVFVLLLFEIFSACFAFFFGHGRCFVVLLFVLRGKS